MRKKLFIMLLMLIILSILTHKMSSQTMSQYAITSSGGDYTPNSNNHAIWTLGDFITETNGTGKYVTQGFLQPELWFITATKDILYFDFKVYPNPFTTYFDIELPQGYGFNLQLMDISGKTIKEYQNAKGSQRFNILGLASDIYFLIITKENSEIRSTFKLIKLK